MPTQLLKLSELAEVRSGYTFRGALEHDPSGDVREFFIVSAKKPNVLPEYLCWMINLPQSQRSLERSGSSIQAISKGALQDMLIPLPPLATQQKLVDLQRLWDEEDQLIARLQTNREQMLQGIYQHLIKD